MPRIPSLRAYESGDSETLSDAVHGPLQPFGGETQLWAGTPRQGIVLGPLDLFVIPFGLMWTAFAVFMETSIVRANGPLFMRLFGVGSS